MPPTPTFGTLLSSYLDKQDQSASWLARRLKVQPSTVTNWINENTRPRNPETVGRVADALGIHDKTERANLLASVGYAYQEGEREGARETEQKSTGNIPVSNEPTVNPTTVLPVKKASVIPTEFHGNNHANHTPSAVQNEPFEETQLMHKEVRYKASGHVVLKALPWLLSVVELLGLSYMVLTVWPLGQRILVYGLLFTLAVFLLYYLRRYGLSLRLDPLLSFVPRVMVTNRWFLTGAWLLVLGLFFAGLILGNHKLRYGLILSQNENGDLYGHSLAVGDFDADGFDDIAIGAPGEAPFFNLFARSGWVYTRRGSKNWPDQSMSIGQAPTGYNEAGDKFGWSLAVGDFNGDQIDDLVIGAPGESPGSLWGVKAGAIFVQKGSQSDGLVPWRALAQFGLSQDEPEDRFGWALAAGDFNGNGFDDIAAGAPGEKMAGSVVESGSVYIYRGGNTTFQAHQSIDQNRADINEADDLFGYAVAAGDFDGDGRADLAVGAPGEVIEAIGYQPRSGSVYTFRGMADGLHAWQALDQSELESTAIGNLFGHALAVGNFNGDRYDDLAIGAPGEIFHSASDSWQAGSVFIFHGSAEGLKPSQFLEQKPVGLNEDGDLFGWSLATGDLNGDGVDDLVIGAPGERPDSPPQNYRAGAAFTFYANEEQLYPKRQFGQMELGSDEADDRFGWAIAAGDFDNDDRADVVVGAPGETMSIDLQSGYGFTYLSTNSGLEGWHGIHQESR